MSHPDHPRHHHELRTARDFHHDHDRHGHLRGNAYWWQYGYAYNTYGPYSLGMAPATLATPAYVPEAVSPGAAYGAPSEYANGTPRDLADLIRADGESKLIREHIRQERRRFDEERSERAQQPGRRELRHGRANASSTQIWSASALNELLDELSALQENGDAGSTVMIETALLNGINVAPPHGGNVGLLRNKGQLAWPQVLQRKHFSAERATLDELARAAVQQVTSGGRVDPVVLQSIRRRSGELEAKLKQCVPELAPSDYIAAKRFLRHVDEALEALKQPDAANYFNQTYSARGRTVAELVRNMTDHDLHFAPATPGTEQAYLKLYRAMAAYAGSAPSPTARD
jgi:hypothetical protein